jgi:hypothetical protein
MSNAIHDITQSGNSPETDAERIEEGKEIIRAISELKHDMGRNKVLSWVLTIELLLGFKLKSCYW